MTDTSAADGPSHVRVDLSIDQRLALKRAAAALQQEFDGMFGVETIERFLHSSYDQFASRAVGPQLPAAARRTLRPATAARTGQSRRQIRTTASRSCCSCAPTTLAARRWRSASSSTSPAMRRSPGPVAPNPATRSTRPPSRPWPNAASTSPASTPNPGPTKSCKPPTSSSPWAAATPARCSRATATRNGSSTTPPAKTSTPCGRSGTTIERRVRQLLAELEVPTHA